MKLLAFKPASATENVHTDTSTHRHLCLSGRNSQRRLLGLCVCVCVHTRFIFSLFCCVFLSATLQTSLWWVATYLLQNIVETFKVPTSFVLKKLVVICKFLYFKIVSWWCVFCHLCITILFTLLKTRIPWKKTMFYKLYYANEKLVL